MVTSFYVLAAAVLQNDHSVLQNYALVLQNKVSALLYKTCTRLNRVKSV